MSSHHLTSPRRRRRLARPAAVTVAAAALAFIAMSQPTAYAAPATPAPMASHRVTALPPVAVPVGASPFGIVADPTTGTVYVANGGGVALIDGTRCNARVHTGCAATPITAAAGHGNIGITLDPTTRTVYVASGADDAVGVIDAATCNARRSSGCAGPHPAAPVGSLPSHVAADPAHHTLYVSNEGADAPGHTVSMINTLTCNSRRTTGCAALAPTLTSGAVPAGVILDARHHTLFVPNFADQTVSVIDTATCNAVRPTGCVADAPVVHLAGNPVGGVLDPVSGSVLVPTMDPVNGVDAPGWLTMIDTSLCNAGHLAGCARKPVRTVVGLGPIDVAVDAAGRRAYVVNEEGSNVSAVDLKRCNAHHASGCQQAWPTRSIGLDGGGVTFVPRTGTVYASGQAAGTVTVLGGAFRD